MIKFNYNQAINQAAELRQISTQIQTLTQKLEQGLADVSATWKGDSANLFLEKSGRLYGKISKTAKNAQNIAGAIDVAAKAVKAAEDAAQELVKAVTQR